MLQEFFNEFYGIADRFYGFSAKVLDKASISGHAGRVHLENLGDDLYYKPFHNLLRVMIIQAI